MKNKKILIVVALLAAVLVLVICATKSNMETPVVLADKAPTASVAEKLESIIIPKVEFTDANIDEILNYLQEQSKELDPTGEGVNIVFNKGSDDIIQTLTVSLRNLPLSKILDVIQHLTVYKYKVEEYAVYVFPRTEFNELLLTRTFAVPPQAEIFLIDTDAQQNLMARGIVFGDGATAMYLPKVKKLVVRNVADQLDKIEALLKD